MRSHTDDRAPIVDRLLSTLAAASGARPHIVMVESPVALRRTRFVQDLYGRLASTQAGSAPFWPSALSQGPRGTDAARHFVRTWRQLAPDPAWQPPEGVTPPWLWWAMTCESRLADVPYGALRESLWQLARVGRPVAATLARAEIDATPVMQLLDGVGAKPATVEPRSPGIAAGGVVDMDAGRLATVIGAIARSGMPVVLTIAETQWADEPTTELVRALFDLDETSLLVVATAPPESLAGRLSPSGDRFHRIVIEMSRTAPERAEIVTLAPLAGAALSELVAGADPGMAPGVTAERAGATAERTAGRGSARAVGGPAPAARRRARRA